MKLWMSNSMMHHRKEDFLTLENRMYMNLRKRFGFSEFKNKLQYNATFEVLKGRTDVFISFPRDRGRSLCYLLPAVMQKEAKMTLVFCPDIDRINDKLEYLDHLNVKAVSMHTLMSNTKRADIVDDIIGDSIKPQLIYVTPDQMYTRSFKKLYYYLKCTRSLAYLVLDVSYHEYKWQHPGLQNHYDILGMFRKEKMAVQWIILTAFTNSQIVESIAEKVHLNILGYEFEKLVCSSFRPNIIYDITVHDTHTVTSVKNFIDQQDIVDTRYGYVQKQCGLLFCDSVQEAEKMATALSLIGVRIGVLHGELPYEAQLAAQRMFMDGHLQVLSVTSGFTCNVENIRFIIHWELPTSMTNYYRETSLAGKDGRPAKCRIFASGRSLIAFNQKVGYDLKMRPYTINRVVRSYMWFLHSGTANFRYETIRCIHGIYAQYINGRISSNSISCDLCQF